MHEHIVVESKNGKRRVVETKAAHRLLYAVYADINPSLPLCCCRRQEFNITQIARSVDPMRRQHYGYGKFGPNAYQNQWRSYPKTLPCRRKEAQKEGEDRATRFMTIRKLNKYNMYM